MRLVKSLVLLLISIATICVYVSCSKDDDSSSSNISVASLIGTWKISHTKGYEISHTTGAVSVNRPVG